MYRFDDYNIDRRLGMVLIYLNGQERGIMGARRGSQRNQTSSSMAEKLQGLVCTLSPSCTLAGHLRGLSTLCACLFLRASEGAWGGFLFYIGYISVGLPPCGKSLVSTLIEATLVTR